MQTYSLHENFFFLSIFFPRPFPDSSFSVVSFLLFFYLHVTIHAVGEERRNSCSDREASDQKDIRLSSFLPPRFLPSLPPATLITTFLLLSVDQTHKKKLGRKNAGEIRQKKRSAVCLEMRNKFLDTRRCGRASHYVCFFLSFFLFISPKISTKFFSPSRGEANCPPDSEMNGSSV